MLLERGDHVLMRRMLAQIGSADSIELVLNRLVKTKNNVEFLTTLSKAEASS